MRRVVYKASEQPISMSPFTKSGEIIFSRIRKFSDRDDPRKEYIEELTPDAEEAFKVMSFLDDMNGIGWTSELRRIETELRAALLQVAEAVPAGGTPKE